MSPSNGTVTFPSNRTCSSPLSSGSFQTNTFSTSPGPTLYARSSSPGEGEGACWGEGAGDGVCAWLGSLAVGRSEGAKRTRAKSRNHARNPTGDISLSRYGGRPPGNGSEEAITVELSVC